MDLRASIQVWQRVLMKPGEAVFREEVEKPYARWGTAVIWLFGAALVAVLVWLLIFLLFDPITQSMPIMREMFAQTGASPTAVDEMMSQMTQTANMTMFLMLCMMLLGIPGLTLAWSGALWLTARLFGGAGSFEKQTFLLSTFTAPLVMIGVLLYPLPLLGPLLLLFFAFYSLYLTYFALKAAHGLAPGQTAGTLALPLAGMVAFACCLATLWVSMIIAALGVVQ